MQQDGLHAAVDDLLDVFFLENHITVDDDLVTFDGHTFASVFIDEVLEVSMQHTGSEFAAQHALQACFRNLHFFSEVEDIEDVLVGFVADGTQQSGDR